MVNKRRKVNTMKVISACRIAHVAASDNIIIISHPIQALHYVQELLDTGDLVILEPAVGWGKYTHVVVPHAKTKAWDDPGYGSYLAQLEDKA